MKNPDLNNNSRRSTVLGTRGMVATSQPLAVSAGLEILRKGGNAADAAVATAAALNVTEPTSTGIGGDCFALFYDAKTSQVSALNGSGRAPLALSIERLRREGLGEELPPLHPYTITVPGAVAGWSDLLSRHGKLTLGDVLAPAIRLAEEGFPVAPITAYFWERGGERQLAKALNGSELTRDGKTPRSGQIFQNRGLARTFKAIAKHGKTAFYEGEIAHSIVDVVRMSGGCLSAEDLAKHHSTWEQPISATYKGLRLWECPPNGQGLTTLIALNVLEALGIDNLGPLSVERLHLEIEALRVAFADTRWYIADPAINPAPLDMLLSKEYAAQRALYVDRKRATLDHKHSTPVASSDTVYLSVVDGDGNACSFINSNYMGFGTGIVPKGWGFTLQNRGHNFSLDPAHPNALAPGKRPYHTIIPAMVTHAEDEELFASFGVMGGFMQPQGHLRVFLALALDQLDPQSALDLPRYCIGDGSSGGTVSLEEGISMQTMAGLAGMGHPIVPVMGIGRSLFGRGQVILRDRLNGVLSGGSDGRADGCAMPL